jgi:ligand-binding SRPBCC domain-containing protein
MAATFECVTWTILGQSELFDLSRNVDAHKESMANSREEAVAGVTSGLLSLGQQVTWRARHFGIRFRMTSRITEMDAPHHFVDEQVTGPFRSFRHVHEFEEIAGGTQMIDRIEFSAPFGPLGRLVEKLILTRYLKGLIEARNEYLAGR